MYSCFLKLNYTYYDFSTNVHLIPYIHPAGVELGPQDPPGAAGIQTPQ